MIGAASKGNKYSLGLKRSPETRAKVSVARMGNKNFLGSKHTPETRAKMSAAALKREAAKRANERLLALQRRAEGES